MTQFALSELQAQAILDMRLQKLTGLERDKLLEELAEIRRQIEDLMLILTSEERLHEVILEELEAVKAQFGEARRTEIIGEAPEFDPLALIVEEDVVITLTGLDYIKKTPATEYQAQVRGGKGRRGVKTRDEDWVKDVFVVNTHDQLLVFTSLGRCFSLPVHEIPTASRAARGKPVVNLLRFETGEKVASIVPIRSFDEDRFLIFATRAGVVKRTELTQYANVNVAGLLAVRLNEGDDLIAVRLIHEGQEVLLATRLGQSIRFDLSDVRPMGRYTAGVRGIRLREGDTLIGMEVLRGDGAPILTVCERGYGKRTAVDEYRVQGRGGSGIISIQCSERNGPVVAIKQVSEGDQALMISNTGQVIRMAVSGIRTSSRNTQGVKLFALDADEAIVGVALVPEDEVEEDDESVVVALEAPEEDVEAPGAPQVEEGLEDEAPPEDGAAE